MLAYCSAFKVPVVPSGLVNLTKDSVVANVSSKSKTVIPYGSLELFLATVVALFNFLNLLRFGFVIGF